MNGKESTMLGAGLCLVAVALFSQVGETPVAEVKVEFFPVEDQPVVAERPRIKWVKTRAEAIVEQMKTGKPVVTLLTNEDGSCAPCFALANGPLQDPAVVMWVNEETIPVKLTPREFGVRVATPTFHVRQLDGNGFFVRGPVPVRGDGFLGWLQKGVRRLP